MHALFMLKSMEKAVFDTGCGLFILRNLLYLIRKN